VDVLRCVSRAFDLPLDLALYKEWIKEYEADPEKCTSGVWVDTGFAKEWHEAWHNRAWEKTSLPSPVSCIQIGNTGLAFHASELFSFYGLDIRHTSPFDHTLVVGYADDFCGYVSDPKAYEEGDGGLYAAMVVPKILDIPPFTPEAGRAFASGIGGLLRDTAV